VPPAVPVRSGVVEDQVKTYARRLAHYPRGRGRPLPGESGPPGPKLTSFLGDPHASI